MKLFLKKVALFVFAFMLCNIWIVSASAAAPSSEEIQNKIDDYYDVVTSNRTKTVYWNKGQNETQLKSYASQHDFAESVTENACITHGTTHKRGMGCYSNTFSSSSQCHGFARYMCYILYGTAPNYAPGYTAIAKAGTSNDGWTTYAKGAQFPTIQAGDFLRCSGHSAIVYSVSANGQIKVIDCNHFGSGKNPSGACGIYIWNAWNVSDFKAAYERGNAYIIRYGGYLPPSAYVVTGMADTATNTSAILHGSFTTTGDRATECGMLLGTSEGNMTKLGSDKVNTYGTSMFYSTAKYGRTLEPGTTYYYQAYAVVNNTTYKGETKSFITSGTRLESLSISLNRDNLTLAYNTCDKLIATTNPAGISVTWKSSDASVVTVTDGIVAAVGAGTAYITAEVSHGGKTASAICYVTVKEEDKPEVRVTTKGADDITTTSAIVRGNVSVSNGTATECGMYFGRSASDLSFLGSDAINSSNMPFYYSTSKYGWTLMSGTTYYYRAYAIVNGITYWGETESFTTIADVPDPVVTVTTKGADGITATSAIVRGNVSVSNGTATECGMYFGNSASNLSFLGSDTINSSNMPFYYSTSKYGWTLMSGTTYYYRAYAIVNGVTYWGETEFFTTAEDVPTASVTVTTKGADNITQTSAIVRGNVSVSNGTATECGMYFGNSASDLSFLGSDAINSSNMPFYYSTSKYGSTN